MEARTPTGQCESSCDKLVGRETPMRPRDFHSKSTCSSFTVQNENQDKPLEKKLGETGNMTNTLFASKIP
jgi:hypothetical protein